MTVPFVPPPAFALKAIERHDPLWLKLRGHMERRIEQLRRENDQDLDPTKTARIRGQIAALSALVALDRDPLATE